MGAGINPDSKEPMNLNTPEQVQQKYVEHMGETLGPLFYALWNEVSWLHLKWSEYLELYGDKPSRIDLMNRAAPLFFRIIQDTLWEDIILHLARLTDPPQSAGKDNLTVLRLKGFIKDESAANNMCVLVEEAKRSTGFCRDWRNRRIAHRDLVLATGGIAEPLSLASREKVEEALIAIATIMNAVEQQHTSSITVFKPGSGPAGAKALIDVIDYGLKAKDDRLKRLKSGEYSAEDV